MHQFTPDRLPRIAFIVPFFALLTALGGLLLAAEIFVSPITAWGSLVYYGALCWVAMRYYPAAFLLLLWFIFLRATVMISGALIESGAFMPEILVQGEASGAFVRLAAIFTPAILGGVFIIDRLLKYCPSAPPDRDARIASWAYGVIAVTVLIGFGMLALGFQNGFPLLDGIDRFTYRKDVDSRFLNAFLSNRMIIAVLLGMVFTACTGLKKSAAGITFLLLLLLSLLMGEKFTSIALMLITFITPVFLMRAQALASMSRYIIGLGLIISCVTIPAVLLVYGLGENPQTAFKKLSNRAASQAQIWYLADQEDNGFVQLDTIRIDHNLKTLKSLDPDGVRKSSPYIGAHDFMALYLDKNRYINYLDKGISLTLALEGYLLKLFGYLGMLPVYMLVLTIYGAQLAYLAYGISSGNPLRVVLACKMLIWSDYGLKQGYLYSIIGIKSLLLIAIVIAFEIGLRLVIRRRAERQIA